MHVKWVCGECDSNNLQENRLLLRCSVCGKLRTDEPIQRVCESKISLNPLTDDASFRSAVDLPFTLSQIFSFLRYQLSKVKGAAIPAAIIAVTLLACHEIFASPTVFISNMRQCVTMSLCPRALNLLLSLQTAVSIVAQSLRGRGKWVVHTVAHLFSQEASDYELVRYDFFRTNCGRILAHIALWREHVAVNLGVLLEFWTLKGFHLDDVKKIWKRVESTILQW